MTANTFEIDDTKLVEKFVQGSNQLLASTNLRLEVNGGLSQLIARTGDTIAILYLQNNPRTAIVKHSSQFLELIDRILIDRSFVMFGDASRAGFIEYKFFVTPTGYRISYTDPSILWKKWWPTERFQNKQRFNMDILISFKDNWYPVQNINVNTGTYTIKTIAGQLVLKRNDRVLWLAQIQTQPELAAQNTQPEKIIAVPPAIEFNAQGYAQLSSADLARKIQKRQSKIDSEQARLMIKELEQKLQSQIEINRKIESKCYELNHRTTVAEQRLQVIYRFLEEMGIDRQDIFRDRG
jgi:hypothetical protein